MQKYPEPTGISVCVGRIKTIVPVVNVASEYFNSAGVDQERGVYFAEGCSCSDMRESMRECGAVGGGGGG